MTETINLHKTSLRMPGADCSVEHERGKPNSYTCSWPQGDATERQFLELAQTLKTCIGGQYEFHEMGMVDPYVFARNAGVEYYAALNYDFVSLDISSIKATPAQEASGGSPPRGPSHIDADSRREM